MNRISASITAFRCNVFLTVGQRTGGGSDDDIGTGSRRRRNEVGWLLRWCETVDDDTDDTDDDRNDDDDRDTTEYALTAGNSTFPSDNNNDNDAMNSTNSNNIFLPVFSIINALLFRLSVVSSSLCLLHMFVDDRCLTF